MFLLDIFKKKKYKHRILTIDGGGLKGYFAAYSFWRLQEDFDIDVKKEFDTFAGTSTGSLIAASIVTGVGYKNLVEIYENGEKNFFLKNRMIKRFNSGYYPKYSNESILNYIRKFFGNYNFNDVWHLSKKGLLIYSTNLTDSIPAIFGTPNFNKDKAIKSSEYLLEEALLASSAAPSYFPTVELKDRDEKENKSSKKKTKIFVDGAVWANDPSLITYALVKKQYDLKDEEIKLLSYGYTRKQPQFIEAKQRGNKEVVDVVNSKSVETFSNLIGSTLSISTYLNNYILGLNLGDTHYKRIDIISEKAFGLDTLTEDYKQLARDAYEEQKEEIRDFILRKQW